LESHGFRWEAYSNGAQVNQFLIKVLQIAKRFWTILRSGHPPPPAPERVLGRLLFLCCVAPLAVNKRQWRPNYKSQPSALLYFHLRKGRRRPLPREIRARSPGALPCNCQLPAAQHIGSERPIGQTFSEGRCADEEPRVKDPASLKVHKTTSIYIYIYICISHPGSGPEPVQNP
jgi:hypothetical protein